MGAEGTEQSAAEVRDKEMKGQCSKACQKCACDHFNSCHDLKNVKWDEAKMDGDGKSLLITFTRFTRGLGTSKNNHAWKKRKLKSRS